MVQGRIADVYRPGRHELTTANMPVLTTLHGWKHGFDSPFKVDVYFVSTKQFTNLKWGTPNPVILRDPEFKQVRVRAFGTFALKVATTLTNESFKHLLLPLWLCAYTYRSKLYHFLVNGQKGRVSGSRPVSFWKVVLLVLLWLLVAGVAFYIWGRSDSDATVNARFGYRP